MSYNPRREEGGGRKIAMKISMERNDRMYTVTVGEEPIVTLWAWTDKEVKELSIKYAESTARGTPKTSLSAFGLITPVITTLAAGTTSTTLKRYLASFLPPSLPPTNNDNN